MFIDTHCHLSIKDYDDIDKIIKDNRNNGVKKIIISVCEYSDFDRCYFPDDNSEDAVVLMELDFKRQA